MVRVVTKKDTDQIKRLWEYCFDDTEEFIEYYFSECYEPNNTLAIYDGDKLCSSLQLRPYEINIRGRKLKAYYIVGVATWPEYRKRGYITELIKHAGKLMNTRGYYISILLPFDYSFYSKYGWEVCYDLLHYSNLDLKKYDLDINKSNYFRLNSGEDVTNLNDIYEAYVEHNNGYITRDEGIWDIILNDIKIDDGYCYLYKEKDMPLGYVLYSKGASSIVIRELACKNQKVQRKLFAFMLDNTNGQEFLWKAPVSDKTFAYKQDTSIKISKEAYVMGRIQNVQGALSGLRSNNVNLIIKVIDSIYTENDGCFLIRSIDGILLVDKTHKDPDLELSIKYLTQLFWGYTSVEQLVREGLLIDYNKRALRMLDSLFPKKYNYIMEDF